LARESERHVLGAISVARLDDTRLTRRIFTSKEISELAMTRPDLNGNAQYEREKERERERDSLACESLPIFADIFLAIFFIRASE